MCGIGPHESDETASPFSYLWTVHDCRPHRLLTDMHDVHVNRVGFPCPIACVTTELGSCAIFKHWSWTMIHDFMPVVSSDSNVA